MTASLAHPDRGSIATIALSRVSSLDDIKRLDREIENATSAPSSAVELDLSGLSARGPARSLGRFGPIATNLLLRDEVQTRHWHVRVPSGTASHVQLARSGVLFAVSRHRHSQIIEDRGSDQFEQELAKWKYDFATGSPQGALFSLPFEDDRPAPAEFGTQLLAFLNPPRSRVGTASRSNAMYPWLTKLTKGQFKYSSSARMNMLREISMITTELLDNVSDHASADYALMTLSRIDDCIQLAVIDNGRGIPSTVAAREGWSDPQVYLRELVDNTHALRFMGHGDGIAKVARKTKKFKGSLLIASGPVGDHGKTVVVDYDFSSGNSRSYTSIEDISAAGTVVVVRLPLDADLYEE